MKRKEMRINSICDAHGELVSPSKRARSAGLSKSTPESTKAGRKQTRFSKEQLQVLRIWLEDHKSDPYPDEEAKKKLADKTGMSKEQICNWFVNYRQRHWSNKTQSFSEVHQKKYGASRTPKSAELPKVEQYGPSLHGLSLEPWKIMHAYPASLVPAASIPASLSINKLKNKSTFVERSQSESITLVRNAASSSPIQRRHQNTAISRTESTTTTESFSSSVDSSDSHSSSTASLPGHNSQRALGTNNTVFKCNDKSENVSSLQQLMDQLQTTLNGSTNPYGLGAVGRPGSVTSRASADVLLPFLSPNCSIDFAPGPNTASSDNVQLLNDDGSNQTIPVEVTESDWDEVKQLLLSPNFELFV